MTRQTLKGEPKQGWFPDQRLTIEEAIEAGTKNPARASFEEARNCTLTVGKLADISVWDRKLVESSARLLDAQALSAVSGGAWSTTQRLDRVAATAVWPRRPPPGGDLRDTVPLPHNRESE